MEKVLVQILQGTQILGVLFNVGEELALKIKALFTPLGPDIQVNIYSMGTQAITSNNDTITAVNAFLQSKGLPVLQIPLTDPGTAPTPKSPASS